MLCRGPIELFLFFVVAGSNARMVCVYSLPNTTLDLSNDEVFSPVDSHYSSSSPDFDHRFVVVCLPVGSCRRSREPFILSFLRNANDLHFFNSSIVRDVAFLSLSQILVRQGHAGGAPCIAQAKYNPLASPMYKRVLGLICGRVLHNYSSNQRHARAIECLYCNQ